jgi:hypothetical protein
VRFLSCAPFACAHSATNAPAMIFFDKYFFVLYLHAPQRSNWAFPAHRKNLVRAAYLIFIKRYVCGIASIFKTFQKINKNYHGVLPGE